MKFSNLFIFLAVALLILAYKSPDVYHAISGRAVAEVDGFWDDHKGELKEKASEVGSKAKAGLSEKIRSEDSLVFCTWNVQIFGRSKMGKSDVVSAMVDEIRRCDVLAFQEIRDASNTAFPSLMKMLPEYEYVISERLGRSRSKEQYALIYRDGFDVVESFVVSDEGDVFEREPFVVSLDVGENVVRFVQIHTKPDDATREIEYFLELGFDDAVFLGDYNADCSYFDEDDFDSYLLEGQVLVVPNDEDTTVSSTDCAYDRIVVSGFLIDAFEGYGVDRFQEYSSELRGALSDHFLVFAEFNI